MKLSESLNSALNEQVLHELHNQNIYLQIASYFEDLQLKNISQYFYNQSNHEKEHANKFIKYINSRTGGKVDIIEINSLNLNLSTKESVANIYVLTEESTTESIESIMDLLIEEKSYIDMGFIQEMLNEQVEEEDSASEFALKLKMCNDLVLFDATLEVEG